MFQDIAFITLTNNGYIEYTENCLKSLEKINSNVNLKCYCIGKKGYEYLNNNNAYFSDKNFHLEKSHKEIEQKIKEIKQKTVTIENVYQEKYNNINGSGLGDFIRGSYFLMEFCDKNK